MKQENQAALNSKITAPAAYLLQLIRCALNGESVPEKPDLVSWEQLFTESKRQNMLLLAYESIQKLQNRPTGEIGEKWTKWHNKLLTKGINQSVAIETLLNAFCENGVRLLPMKGYYIRQTYPTAELREMTDLDILIHSEDMEKARQMMMEQGYCITGDHDVHGAFSKPPYLAVELHNKLLPEYADGKDYFADVWAKAVPETARSTVFHMNPSDTLTHILLHFAKHYLKNSSCGIRFAVDFFTYCRYYEAQLDWDYLWNEWDKLQVRKLAEDVLGLGQAWFGDGTLSDSQLEMGTVMCNSGVFGNAAGYDRNRIMQLTPKNGNVKIGKVRYFFRIMFPPLEEMQLGYPVLRKAPVLLPFTWVHRGFKTVFCNPEHIKKYYKRTKEAVVNSDNK